MSTPDRPPSVPPRPTPPPLPTGVEPKKKSLVWLWVTLGVLGVLGIGLATVAVGVFVTKMEEGMSGLIDLADESFWEPVEVAEVGLLEDRAGHVTEWYDKLRMVSKFEAAGEADVPPEGVFEVVEYPSPAGDLVAYLTPDPRDGEKRPAMVWAKGGFGGIGDFFWEDADPTNDQSAWAFREAGMVMMCPSWRGENDNPGRFELFYGEVDDLLAAVEYVKGLPYVDPERVYIGGHSTGGTMALLASVAGADVRAVFSFGGVTDLGDDLDRTDVYENAPYDHRKDKRGNSLRSAVRYTPFIKAPTFYFEGTEDFAYSVKRMDVTAALHSVPFESFEVPGDHFNILDPLTRLIAEKIAEDDGEVCSIAFTDEELEAAWRRVHDKPVDEVLERWMAEGGNLDELLDEAVGDGGADDREDVTAMEKALKRLMDDESEEGLRCLARVVSLIRPTMDDDALEAFDERLAGRVRQWVRANAGAEVADAKADAVFSVVVSLIYNFDDEAGAIVLELMEREFQLEHSGWDDVLESLDPEDGMFEEVVAGVRKDLPEGELGAMVMHWASHRMLNEDWAGKHPFDSEEGGKRLRGYLEGNDFSAYRAGFALAFVSEEVREGLVELGLKHEDPEVRFEVAWSDLRSGGELGVAVLAEGSLDVEHSRLAVRYLEEFERGDAVPEAAREPEFAAKAEMAGWLQHPNELGKMPETLEVFDARELHWPPTEQKEQVWLMKFTYRFDEEDEPSTAYGMVGGGWTWSSFEDYETEPTPEDLYVHHCVMELGWASEEEVTEEKARELLGF